MVFIVGGITGQNNNEDIGNATISNSYNKGTVISTGTAENHGGVGGIAGQNRNQIYNCYNLGELTNNSVVTTTYNYVGGIVGMNLTINEYDAVIDLSYNSGNIDNSSNLAYVNGICINNASIVTNCYYNLDLLTGDNIEGQVEGKTKQEMKSSTFVDLLNSKRKEGYSEWKLDTENKNNGFPILNN